MAKDDLDPKASLRHIRKVEAELRAAEGVEADADALEILARRASGSMRSTA